MDVGSLVSLRTSRRVSDFALSCVVEGHGDREALPVLLRRLLPVIRPGFAFHLTPPFRLPRASLVNPGQLNRIVAVAAERALPRGGVLVLFDADDDCPAEVGPYLRAVAQQARPDVPVELVLANREYEGWLLHGVKGLVQHRLMPASIERLGGDAEQVRDAKGMLSSLMVNASYRPTLHQAAFTQLFDIGAAQQASRSFRQLVSAITRLVGE